MGSTSNEFGSPGQNPGAQRHLGSFELWMALSIGAALLLVLFHMLAPRYPHQIATPRTQCKNNLKQLLLAIHNYHDDYGSFPPAYIANESGQPLHSWRILILPYVDQQALYERYDFQEPWNGPNNIKLQDEMPAAYRCISFAAGPNSKSPEYLLLSRL